MSLSTHILKLNKGTLLCHTWCSFCFRLSILPWVWGETESVSIKTWFYYINVDSEICEVCWQICLRHFWYCHNTTPKLPLVFFSFHICICMFLRGQHASENPVSPDNGHKLQLVSVVIVSYITKTHLWWERDFGCCFFHICIPFLLKWPLHIYQIKIIVSSICHWFTKYHSLCLLSLQVHEHLPIYAASIQEFHNRMDHLLIEQAKLSEVLANDKRYSREQQEITASGRAHWFVKFEVWPLVTLSCQKIEMLLQKITAIHQHYRKDRLTGSKCASLKCYMYIYCSVCAW